MIPTPLLRALCAGTLAALCLAGCASKGPAKEGTDAAAAPARNPLNPTDPAHFIPATAFDAEGTRVGTPATAPLAPSPGLSANAFRPEVILYFSPASRSFYRRGDVDPAINRVLWERFLTKYEIPYRVVEDAAALQQAGTGVLVLPANMALGTDERQAIVDFRARGGSLFASWLLGTHDKDGSWRGFDWMESLLGIGVVGTTAPHEEDRYINPYGDSPVIHALPAGTRIWTERAPGWWPLRITGRNDAAQVRTWSRATDAVRPQVVAAFDEVATANGATSRMVYFGWPERLWMAADPGKHEGLLYDSLTWLLRQPSAWVANWPDAKQSAYVTAVYMADVFNDNDLPFADRLAARGMLATYFILGFEIDKSADTLKALQKRGHELAYEGDEYVGFKDVPIEEQSARMQKMREDVAASGPTVREPAGFYPPMDDVDDNTVIAAARQPFAYMPTWVQATDGCVPFLYGGAGSEGRGRPLVQFPRITRGLEEMLDFFDEEEATDINLAEYDAAHRMGCINLVRFANQSLISEDAQARILDAYADNRDDIWGATGMQVADWWLERARVQAKISGTTNAPVLEITVTGDGPVKQAVAVLVNLPFADAGLVLEPVGDAPALAPERKDALRALINLKGTQPGDYRWNVRFASH
ncbi:hypothetical protein MASR1M8_26810 [Thermomonas brevis]